MYVLAAYVVAVGYDDITCVLLLLVLLWDEGRPDKPVVQAVWGEHELFITRDGHFKCHTDRQSSVKGKKATIRDESIQQPIRGIK